ncbi:MAG: TetR/AcrR family transcriptional regulator [Planctomycetes bacterium]|nr:TetR/AcrR family transcriptional regulator [Planctomycetota bacterium]
MVNPAERRKELLDSIMREAVYEGAVAVLIKHGLDGTTMDRVAAAAGITKGSLYNHFRGKQELLEFVHERLVAPVRQAMDEIVKNEQTAAEKLTLISRRWREYLVQHGAVFQFLINDRAAKGLLRDSEQTSRASGIRQIATVIRQGIDEGAFRPVDPIAAAEMFVSASIGMVEQEFAAGRTRTADEAVDALMAVFLHGLVAR